MSQTLRLPYRPGAPAPGFPEGCAACGAPAATRSTLDLSRLTVRGRQGKQQETTLKLAVPHCARCAQLTKSIFLVSLVPFAAGFVLVGLAAFAAGFWLATRWGLDEVETDDVMWPSLTVGAAAGLFAGLLAAFLAELAARLLLLPFFGRPLLAAPTLTAQFLGGGDYVAGVGGKMAPDGSAYELRFTNDTVAQAFAALNRLGG